MRADSFLHDGRIVVRTEGGNFDAALAACKSVRGARWRKELRAWSYPLSVDTCTDLRKAFGSSLRVGQDLADWYRSAQQAAAQHAALAAAADAELRRLPVAAPALASALRPDQRAGVAWIARGYANAGLVADMPGLGKTLEVIGGILEAGIQGPILVACPRVSVRSVWLHEIRRWTNEKVYICRGTRAQRNAAISKFLEDTSERKWLVTVVETLRVKEVAGDNGKPKFDGYEYPALFGIEWGAVIVDESHRAFGSLTVVKGNRAGKGLKRLSTDRRYAVTGTPFGKGGRLIGMFGTLNWLWPEEYTSFWRWAENHFHISEEEVYIRGGRGRTRATKRVGELRDGKDGEAFLRELGPRVLRRTKAEVMPWLPPKQYVEVVCEMGPLQRRQYIDLQENGELAVEGGVVSADGVLAHITRSKQIANGAIMRRTDDKVVFDPANSAKLDSLLQLLDQRGVLDGSGSTKVLVTSQFNEMLYALEELLAKTEAEWVTVTGAVTDKARERAMADFQAPNGPRLFLLNAKAGGVSITLDAADEVHMLDELWDPGDNEQVEDRAHRASRALKESEAKNRPPVTIYQYRTEGTIDTSIGEDVEARRKNQHLVMDTRRGLVYAREITRYRKPQEEK